MMQLYIRRAGWWNANNFELSSQFGHIMLRIDDVLYSFNQRQFLPLESQMGCVQMIDVPTFQQTYAGQTWDIVTLAVSDSETAAAQAYFHGPATTSAYSLTNTCVVQCQRALAAAGVAFSHDCSLPGSVLCAVKKPANSRFVKRIERVVV